MSNSEMNQYLDMLSDELVELYGISKSQSVELVENSPMRKLLRKDSAYVTHVPISSWAEMIYESQS